MLRPLDADTCKTIEEAIRHHRLLQLRYGGYERVVEPHIFGKSGGIVRLLCFQLSGGTASGGLPQWRLLAVDRISGCVMLDAPFAGSRPNSEEGFRFEAIFAVVS